MANIISKFSCETKTASDVSVQPSCISIHNSSSSLSISPISIIKNSEERKHEQTIQKIRFLCRSEHDLKKRHI